MTAHSGPGMVNSHSTSRPGTNSGGPAGVWKDRAHGVGASTGAHVCPVRMGPVSPHSAVRGPQTASPKETSGLLVEAPWGGQPNPAAGGRGVQAGTDSPSPCGLHQDQGQPPPLCLALLPLPPRRRPLGTGRPRARCRASLNLTTEQEKSDPPCTFLMRTAQHRARCVRALPGGRTPSPTRPCLPLPCANGNAGTSGQGGRREAEKASHSPGNTAQTFLFFAYSKNLINKKKKINSVF